jgi:hypothetical protein
LKVHQEKEEEKDDDLDVGKEYRFFSGVPVDVVATKNKKKNKPASVEVYIE